MVRADWQGALASSSRQVSRSLISVNTSIGPMSTPHRSIRVSDLEVPDRLGCDSAYPDARTYIAPGPHSIRGAITDERNFTVLPPDPQSLDRDRDGIGCEPVTSS